MWIRVLWSGKTNRWGQFRVEKPQLWYWLGDQAWPKDWEFAVLWREVDLCSAIGRNDCQVRFWKWIKLRTNPCERMETWLLGTDPCQNRRSTKNNKVPWFWQVPAYEVLFAYWACESVCLQNCNHAKLLQIRPSAQAVVPLKPRRIVESTH